MTTNDNDQLRSLYEADQQERRDGQSDGMAQRDEKRREQVEHLIAGGQLNSADDYFHAAMLFQHGRHADHYRRAHEFAVRAAELGSENGRWLAAAAYDRWLMSEGKPQKYGTQYRADGGRWVLYDVDPQTTDEERAEWNVPPLRDAIARAAQLTKESPPSR